MQLPKMEEETGNLNSSMSVKYIEFVIKTPSREKGIGPDGFTSGIYQMLKEGTVVLLPRLCWKAVEAGPLHRLCFM